MPELKQQKRRALSPRLLCLSPLPRHRNVRMKGKLALFLLISLLVLTDLDTHKPSVKFDNCSFVQTPAVFTGPHDTVMIQQGSAYMVLASSALLRVSHWINEHTLLCAVRLPIAQEEPLKDLVSLLGV